MSRYVEVREMLEAAPIRAMFTIGGHIDQLILKIGPDKMLDQDGDPRDMSCYFDLDMRELPNGTKLTYYTPTKPNNNVPKR